MKINFKSILIENFMSIGNAQIQLNDQGYMLVSGINNNPTDTARSNGSGKSSIFEAIVWCLTGETMRGNKDIVNRYGDDGALVDMQFVINDNTYKLIRTKDHSQHKTNLKIYIDGEDKSGKGIRDSEKLLKDYLPDLTPSLIGSVIVLGQGLPSRFTNNSPSGRKEVLEKLCKSDFMIEDLKDRISSRKSSLQSILRATEDNLLTLKTKLSMTEKSLSNKEANLVTLNETPDYSERINEVNGIIQQYENELNELRIAINYKNRIIEDTNNTIFNTQQQRANDEQVVLDKYTDGINNLQTTINDVKVELNTRKQELNKLRNITDICPTCKQKLPDVHKPDTRELECNIGEKEIELKDYECQISELKFNRQQEIDNVREQHGNMLSRYRNDVAKYNEELDSLNVQQNNISYKLKESEKELTYMQHSMSTRAKEIEDCISSIDTYKQEIQTLNNDILYKTNEESNINDRLSIINKFNTVVTRDFRGYLLQNFIKFIDDKAKEYCQDIFGTTLIEFKLDGNNISISYNDKQYEALSGGERQKVDLIIQFSIRDMLCKYTNFSTNLLVLDEIFDNLDDLGSQKIIDLISNKLCDISSIFIISHHGNELNIPYDNELIIVKNSDGVSLIQ